MSIDRTSPANDIRSDLLENARTALERERRELEDERIAFERFLDRLRELEASQPQSIDSSMRTVRRTAGLTRVREAFAETVMSVPHFFERYDESFAEHLAGELTEELAVAVVQGSTLHPQLKRSLLEATENALDSRNRLLEMIEDERADVERATATLESLVDEFVSVTNQPVERLEFNALRLTRVRLRELRDRCDELATQRQEFVRDRRRTPLATGQDFSSYLYGPCESHHPILSSIATLGSLIDRELRRVERNLVSAV